MHFSTHTQLWLHSFFLSVSKFFLFRSIMQHFSLLLPLNSWTLALRKCQESQDSLFQSFLSFIFTADMFSSFFFLFLNNLYFCYKPIYLKLTYILSIIFVLTAIIWCFKLNRSHHFPSGVCLIFYVKCRIFSSQDNINIGTRCPV